MRVGMGVREVSSRRIIMRENGVSRNRMEKRVPGEGGPPRAVKYADPPPPGLAGGAEAKLRPGIKRFFDKKILLII